MRRELKSVVWTLTMAVLVACGGVSEWQEVSPETGQRAQPVLYAPPTAASGNVRDSTAYLGPVNFGVPVQTSFTTNPQYYSFTLQSPGNLQAALEVTHGGSSMYLDTGLFVYGPKNASGGYGSTPIAQDDDAGYGELSKIASVSLQAGEYLVVVSSGNGSGKQFRLQTSCLSGACPTSLPPAPSGYQLTLSEGSITSQLQATLDAGNAAHDYTDGHLRHFDFAWPYSGEASLAQADAAVMALQDYEPYSIDSGTALTYSQAQSYFYSDYQPLAPQLLSTYGNGSENVQVMTHYYSRLVAPGASGWFRLFIILFPQSKKIIVFEQIGYET